MPADLLSVLIVILLQAADTVEQVGPYVLGGIVAAAVLSRLLRRGPGIALSRVPRLLVTPWACVAGAVSPLPTASVVPTVVRLRAEGVPASAALAFVLASSLLNPQMFLLTAGAFGMRFALAQLGCVLGLSMGVGLWLAGQDSAVHPEGGDRDGAAVERQTSCRAQVVGLAGHVGLHFSIGVLVGASLRVLLPWLGIVDWIGNRGWLSSPLLGWMGAPFYTCGGSAIPLARSLLQSGFSPGALFTFLLVGPALRGTTLANLSCLLPKRSLALCLVALSLGGGLLGYAFEVLVGVL